MIGSSQDPGTDAQSEGSRPAASPPGMPGWVKAFGIVALVLIMLFVVLHLTGHGMGGHGL